MSLLLQSFTNYQELLFNINHTADILSNVTKHFNNIDLSVDNINNIYKQLNQLEQSVDTLHYCIIQLKHNHDIYQHNDNDNINHNETIRMNDAYTIVIDTLTIEYECKKQIVDDLNSNLHSMIKKQQQQQYNSNIYENYHSAWLYCISNSINQKFDDSLSCVIQCIKQLDNRT